MPKISFIGDLTLDWYPQLKKELPGGASLISAVWAKRLGAEATILAAVGRDKVGSFSGRPKALLKTRPFLEVCQKEGINRDYIKIFRGKTSTIEIFVNEKGERSFGKWDPGVYAKYHLNKKDWEFLKIQDAIVMPLYFKTRHLLKEILSNHQLLIQSPLTNHQSPLIVIDFDDLSQFGPPSPGCAGLRRASKETKIIEDNLRYIDIVKLGLDIEKDKGLIEKIEKFEHFSLSRNDKYKVFLITLGKHGSLVFANGKTYRQKAQKVKVKNTNGAGDAFLAGFLMEYLESENIKKSLTIGSSVAALGIAKIGAY